jgi:hypothetical protein
MPLSYPVYPKESTTALGGDSDRGKVIQLAKYERRVSLQSSNETYTNPEVSGYYETMGDALAEAAQPALALREVVQVYKRVLFGYSLFASVGLISLTCFILLGALDFISIPVTIFGSVLSALIPTGVVYDFRRWERKHV